MQPHTVRKKQQDWIWAAIDPRGDASCEKARGPGRGHWRGDCAAAFVPYTGSKAPVLQVNSQKTSRPVSRVLSRTIIPLESPSPATSSGLPGSARGHALPLCAATSLFGLAPGGVCRATECCHRRGALLPHRFTLTGFIAEASAVCFLLHFPSAHAAQALPGTSSAGARTFLHISREMQRPSSRLRGAP